MATYRREGYFPTRFARHNASSLEILSVGDRGFAIGIDAIVAILERLISRVRRSRTA